MKRSIVLIVALSMIVPVILIPGPAEGLRYGMDTDLGNMDASFLGEYSGDSIGLSIAVSGDVNGDGYDDILIGSNYNDEGGEDAGQTYLIFGKTSGWTMDTNLSNADASFIGEYSGDNSGHSVSGAGDVNGDGYDDILIGAFRNDEGGNDAGQTYLIFGKPSNWTTDTNLSNADASFIGEDIGEQSGYSVRDAGDVNGDGYDDFLIGAYRDKEAGEEAGETYLLFGKSSGWTKDTNLSNADASFLGERNGDRSSGHRSAIGGKGDVNGDGFDDILIGAFWNDEGGADAGQTYLVFGKVSEWTTDMNLSNSDASFIGENAGDQSGLSLDIIRDVNGDGFDDILIGASNNEEGGFRSGQTYLMFGNRSGWSMDTDLSNADASFWGEDTYDFSGTSVTGLGDINGDPFNDFLIGAYGNEDGGGPSTGKSYLILGKKSGWYMDINLSNANASFVGEDKGDQSGFVIAGNGDINGDGYDDILISAHANDEGAINVGQTYLIFPDFNSNPNTITSVKAYSDAEFTNEIFSARVNDTIYIELIGSDGNTSRADLALVNVTSDMSSPLGFRLRLSETDLNTAIYRGNFSIVNRTHERNKWIGATPGENITISSIDDPKKYVVLNLYCPPVKLKPLSDIINVLEDELYQVHYSSAGCNPVSTWTFDTNASWLDWNGTTHNISGTPDNADVGSYWVRINITDGLGNYDEHNFTLTVKNTPPNITTASVNTTLQSEPYVVDYDCGDEGQGDTAWDLETDATWLQMNATSGILNGTPTNDDLGIFEVNISVDDGNGGHDNTSFNLTVLNVNDAPIITTEDVNHTRQGQHYNVTYEALEIDEGDSFAWALSSNATAWLEFNEYTGLLEGTPSNDDVGQYWVNITAMDQNNGTDTHNFTLTVENVNDRPRITSTPPLEAEVLHKYEYQVEADDIDIVHGDVLNHTLGSAPPNMTIDRATGLVEWWPTRDERGTNPVIIKVSDGELDALQHLNITVSVPRPSLLVPKDGAVVDTATPELFWSFIHNGTGTVEYELYLDESEYPTTLISGDINRTDHQLAGPLSNDTTYHWRVVPTLGDLRGDSSPVWSFSVDLGQAPSYIVRLELDRYTLDLDRGGKGRIVMTVHNDGNRRASINLSIDADIGDLTIEGPNTFELDPSGSRSIPLVISVPDDMEYGEYNVSITADMRDSTSMKSLTVNIEEPGSPAPSVPIWEEPVFWLLLLAVIIIASLGIGYTTYRRKKMEGELDAARSEFEEELAAARARAEEVEDFDIDEIFLIYQDGRLITHVSPKESDIDEQIFGGMLVAVQSFVQDSFQADEGLTSFEFGSRKMVLEKGNHLFLAVALSGTEPPILKENMRSLVQKIEGLYAGVVEEWDGNVGSFKAVEHLLVPLFRIKEGLKIKEEKEEVRMLSGVEFYRGYVRLKVAIKNRLSADIRDVKMMLSYDDKVLRLDHIEPDYRRYGTTVMLDPIPTGEKRTVAFYLDPMICQESSVEGMVTFVDEYGNTGEAEMKRRPVDIICPIFYTPETVNVAMLKRLLEDMKYRDSKIYRARDRTVLDDLYRVGKDVVSGHDVRSVREFTEQDPKQVESWYYGEVKETKEKLVMMVVSREDDMCLEIFVASNNLGSMTGLLAELGSEFDSKITAEGLDRQVSRPVGEEEESDAVDRARLLLDRYGEG